MNIILLLIIVFSYHLYVPTKVIDYIYLNKFISDSKKCKSIRRVGIKANFSLLKIRQNALKRPEQSSNLFKNASPYGRFI